MAGVFIPHQFNEWKAKREFASRFVFGSCLVAGLLLCSCATPYKPLDHRYGFSEQQVTNDVYEVTFLGNADSSYERVLDFAMLRAAEIALSRQAKSFTLLDVVNLSFARPYLAAPHSYWIAASSLSVGSQNMVPAVGLFDGPEWSYLMMEPAQKRTYYRPGVKLKVKLLSDAPGTYYPYDPAKESERLKRKYRMKPGKH